MAKTMNELLDIINASDPESGEEFLKLLQPEKYDRIEMGSILESTLGNNLITYYDEKYAESYLEKIETHPDIPDEVKDYVKESKDELVAGAMDLLDNTRPNIIESGIEAAIEEATGFDVTDYFDPPDDDELLGLDNEPEEDSVYEEEDEEDESDNEEE